MHELDVTKELVRQLKIVLEENKIKRGEAVVELGKLTTYVGEPIRFYFKQITNDDEFFSDKNISLRIEEKEGVLNCLDCGKSNYITEVFERICPECNSINTKIEGGDQLMIKKLEKFE